MSEMFIVQYTSKTNGSVFVIASKGIMNTLRDREAKLRSLGTCACVSATKRNLKEENQRLLSTLEKTAPGMVDNIYILQEVYA